MSAVSLVLEITQVITVRARNGFMKLSDIRKYLLIMTILQGIVQRGSGQVADKIISDLVKSGFENTRCIIEDDRCYVSIENHTFRWDVLAISGALDIIASGLNGSLEINLLILDNAMPQKLICVSRDEWRKFSTGSIDSSGISDRISVTFRTREVYSRLKHAEVFNRGSGKFDLVIYPQFYFENTLLNKLYETQFNLAPAAEFSLWKGNKFMGQVILPIQNSLGYEGDHIRPGFLTISQEFRISDGFHTTITAGNFIGNSYGISACSRLYIFNGLFNVEMTNGIIGSSHFIEHKWIHNGLDSYTGSLSLAWFWSRFNMELKAGAARHLNEDHGIFASCARSFNETVVGLYIEKGEFSNNGGFFFSIPLFFRQRSARKLFRITIPPQYGFTYNAGTEYYYGQTVKTEPNSIFRDRFKWDQSIKNFITKIKNYSQ